MNGFRLLNFRNKAILKLLNLKNHFAVYLFLLVVFMAGLLSLPLIGDLGFEYSLFTSVFLAFLLPPFFISSYKRTSQISNFYNNFFIQLAVIVFLPLLIGVIKSLAVFPKATIDGVLFYILLVLPNVAVAFTVTVIVLWSLKRFRLIVCYVILLLIITLALLEIYFYPQVYFYNPVIGYYPGTIYDEGIGIDKYLISYRLIIAFFFTAAGVIPFVNLLNGVNTSTVKKSLYIFSILTISGVFYFISPAFGFSTSPARMQQELNKKTETEHFVIYSSPLLSENNRKIIAAEHEYYYSVLTGFYKSSPQKKITSYVFIDDVQKKKYLGAGNADIAKPWLYEIYTEAGSREQTLKHEISHCFTAEFGTTIFKVAHYFNPGLIEGIAMASEGVYDGNPVDEVVANAYRSGYKVNLPVLFNNQMNFFVNASSLSYAYSGSFVKYLIDKYGIDKFKTLYKTGNFENCYNKNIDKLSEEFYCKLDSIKTPVNKNRAVYYFGGKSIFRKVSPRYVAIRTEEAWDYYNNEDYSTALAIFTELERLTSNYSSLSGQTACQIKAGQPIKAATVLRKHLAAFKNTNYYYSIELKYADALSICNRFGLADSIYSAIYDQNPAERYRKIVFLRKELLKSGRIKEYLVNNEVSRYLILKNLIFQGQINTAIPAFLELSSALGIPYNDTDVFLEGKAGLGKSKNITPENLLSIAEYFYMNLQFTKADKYVVKAYEAMSEISPVKQEFRNKVKFVAEYLQKHSNI